MIVIKDKNNVNLPEARDASVISFSIVRLGQDVLLKVSEWVLPRLSADKPTIEGGNSLS